MSLILNTTTPLSEGNLIINPAGVHHFVIAHDGQAQAGIAENITITAKDANNATVTNYTGTINIDTTGTSGTITWAKVTGSGAFIDGGAGVDTAIYTYSAADNGIVILSITDTTAETLNISVSGSGKSDDNTESNLVVNPSALHHFVIVHDNSAEAGVAEEMSITAKDTYGNTITNYTGTITVDTNGTATAISWGLALGNGTFVDGGAGVDTAAYTYHSSDSGVVILRIIDTQVETINISVSGGGKTDDNTEGNLVVGAGALDHFIIAHDGLAVAGIADAVTVTAYDVYNNIKRNYTGTITLDTGGTATAINWSVSSGLGVFSDGGASVDTATYTFVGADNGAAVFMITDTKAETIDIDVSAS